MLALFKLINIHALDNITKMTQKDKEEKLKKLLKQNKYNEISTLLLNSVYTNTFMEKNELFEHFYDFVAEKFQNDEPRIYQYLKKNFDPELIQIIIDAKFPGCLDGCKDHLESLVGEKFIEKRMDGINSSEKSKVIIATILTTFGMEMKLIDLFKDLGLSFYMLGLIGGVEAIVDLPTNFKSVIIIVMFASVLIPPLLSSLHLVVNNPRMIVGMGRMKRYLSIPLCFFLSMMNQIFLTCTYQENKEKARKLAQKGDTNVIKKLAWCRKIKQQNIKFTQLELG